MTGPQPERGLFRRDFLVRTGLALGTGLLAGAWPAGARSDSSSPPLDVGTWEAIRQQFHLAPELIHLSCFFLSSHPAPVRDAIERHRRELDRDPIGYWFAQVEPLEAAVLRSAADYLGVAATDIALTDSTTMGLGLLYGGLTLKPGQEILSTIHDHYSTDISLRHRADRTGADFRQIPLYRDLATVSLEELTETLVKAVRPQTRIVAVTWVHSSTGLKLPIRAMADALARINATRDESERVLLCVDGVHGLGVEDVRLPELGCDFFVAGCHKWLFGPRGTGLVWGHSRAWPVANPIIPTFNLDAYHLWMNEIPPKEVPKAALMTPGGFHSFEHRWALAEAFRFHQTIGKRHVMERIHHLNDRVKAGLADIPGVTLRTPRSRELSAGIVCFDIVGLTPERAVEHLKARRILASVTPYATKHVRIAPSLVTSADEIEVALREIQMMAKGQGVG